MNILQGLGDENPYQRPIAIHPTPLAAKLKAPFETDSPLTPLPSDYQSPEANYAKSQTARDPTEPDLEPWGQPRASYTFGESSAAGLQEPPAYSWGEASEQQREREERIQRYLQSQIIEPQEPSVKEEVRSDISYLTQQEYPPLPSSPRPDLRGSRRSRSRSSTHQSSNHETRHSRSEMSDHGGDAGGVRRQYKPMPARRSKEAPEFDETEPESLMRYFEDLEACFENAGLTNDTEKKKYVGRYVKARLESEWSTLSGAEDGNSYQDYKAQIMGDYYAVGSLKRGSIKRLTQICKEHQRISANDIDDLLTLKRQFSAEAKKLMEPPALLANHTLVENFMGCLTRDFREKVYQQLESNARTDIRIKKAITANAPAGLVPPAPVPARPTRHRPEDRFELDEVIAMAEEIAREQNPGVAAVSLNSRTGGAAAAPPMVVKTESFKLEPLTQQLEELRAELAMSRDREVERQKRFVEEVRAAMQQGMHNAPAPLPAQPKLYEPRAPNPSYARPEYPTTMKCFYCGLQGHTFNRCPAKEAHIQLGKIIDKGSRVHLPDHTYLGVDPNRTILSRVEEYHAQKKLDSNYLNYGGQSVLQLAQIQQQVGPNSVFTNKAKDTRDDLISALQKENASLKVLMNGHSEVLPTMAASSSSSDLDLVPRRLPDPEEYGDRYHDALRKEREELMSLISQLDYSQPEAAGFTST